MTEEEKREKYRGLLIRRDTLKKEGEQAWLQYVKKFGVRLETLLKLKIECITLKKKIAYYQRKQNRKESIDRNELEASLQEELHDYYRALQEISCTQELEFTSIDLSSVLKIKKLYRKIVSLIHPDLHPDLFSRKEIKDLWIQAKAAYESNDLCALQDAEFLILHAIGADADTADSAMLVNIDERMEAIQEEIVRILSTNPYQYKFILEDDALSEEEEERLQLEIDSYELYRSQLQEHFDELQEDAEQKRFTGVVS